jgi:hypothetical protein
MLMAPAWAAGEAAPEPAEPAKVTDFIRVEEDAAKASLQTAVTRYEKDGAHLDLVGAIHIADPDYFRTLNERFTAHDAVLFEMIGGESLAARHADPSAKSDESDPSDPSDLPADQEQNLEALHQIYGMVARFLGLTDQMNRIDYSKENFVHADLSLAEFRQLQSERGESLLGFALEASRQAGEQGAAKQPDTARLLQAMLTGNSNQLKLEIVHSLGAGDDQIAAFAGESVIIGDRNRKCLQVLAAQLAAGRRKLAIFYGAAHFPDMERRLLEAGWQRAGQEWLTAWDIPKEPAKEPAAEAPKKAA